MPRKKKNKNMSLAMDQEMQDLLRRHAKENHVSTSRFLRDLFITYVLGAKDITVIKHDPAYIPIVLKIPVNLKGDRDGVLCWLKIRVSAIAERLAKLSPKD